MTKVILFILDGWENVIKLLEDAVEEHLQQPSSIFERMFERELFYVGNVCVGG